MRRRGSNVTGLISVQDLRRGVGGRGEEWPRQNSGMLMGKCPV